MGMFVEFDMVVVDYDKEREDKERCKDLMQPYDAEELEESFIAKYLVDLSAPLLAIYEDKIKYKGEPYDCIKIVTRDIQTPWLLVSYKEFLDLYQSFDKNFKFYKIEKNGTTI